MLFRSFRHRLSVVSHVQPVPEEPVNISWRRAASIGAGTGGTLRFCAGQSPGTRSADLLLFAERVQYLGTGDADLQVTCSVAMVHPPVGRQAEEGPWKMASCQGRDGVLCG